MMRKTGHITYSKYVTIFGLGFCLESISTLREIRNYIGDMIMHYMQNHGNENELKHHKH